MSALKQLKKDIDKTKGISLHSVCNDAGVSYQSVLNAINNNKDIRLCTLAKMSDVINKRLILIDKDI